MSVLANAIKELNKNCTNSRQKVTPTRCKEHISTAETREPLSVLRKAFKLKSQLIAKSWLEEDPSIFTVEAIIKIFVDNNLITSSDDIDVVIDAHPYRRWSEKDGGERPSEKPPKRNLEGYFRPSEGKEAVEVYTPFPKRPKQLTDEELKMWVQQDPTKEPAESGVVWIPQTC